MPPCPSRLDQNLNPGPPSSTAPRVTSFFTARCTFPGLCPSLSPVHCQASHSISPPSLFKLFTSVLSFPPPSPTQAPLTLQKASFYMEIPRNLASSISSPPPSPPSRQWRAQKLTPRLTSWWSQFSKQFPPFAACLGHPQPRTGRSLLCVPFHPRF